MREVLGELGYFAWQIDLRPVVPVDTLGYAALHFAYHPGDARGERVNGLAINTNSRSPAIDLLRGGWVDMEKAEWQVVEIPLAAFRLAGPLEFIRLHGNLIGTFYLDDIRLVAIPLLPSATAVLEERSDALPQSFSLAQNFPNPFNSSTIIRFALPESEDIELSIFNLAGQKVVTLLDGRCGIGEYTLN
jgi:hypothetical protein